MPACLCCSLSHFCNILSFIVKHLKGVSEKIKENLLIKTGLTLIILQDLHTFTKTIDSRLAGCRKCYAQRKTEIRSEHALRSLFRLPKKWDSERLLVAFSLIVPETLSPSKPGLLFQIERTLYTCSFEHLLSLHGSLLQLQSYIRSHRSDGSH